MTILKEYMGKEYLNNKELERLIKSYKDLQEFPEDKEKVEKIKNELSAAFHTLTVNIVGSYNFPMVDQEEAIQEGVMICFEKINRFNPNYIGENGQKAKAFNFCTTIILNHCRQLYRMAKNYKEFKVKYHNHLCDKMSADHSQGIDRRFVEYRKIDKDEVEHN